MKKPLYSFLFLMSLLVLPGCDNEKSISKICTGPSSMSTDESCFQPENSLEVYAPASQSTTDSVAFTWRVYPQTDPNTIDVSESNEKFTVTLPFGYRITIPGEYINETPRFVLRADMLCDGRVMDSLQYVFTLEDKQTGCKVWVGSKL